MKLVAHISDPHFGEHDPEVATALLDELNTVKPAVVAISGDLTQRGRNAQFIAAREWLDALLVPYVVVPGNHDIPLYDLFTRFLRPRVRYMRYITRELSPCFVDDQLAVCGIDTTKSLTTKHGVASRELVEHVAAALAPHTNHWRILVAHHPFIVPEHHEDDRVVGAAMALPLLEAAGVDLILTGHLHVPYTEDPAGRDPSHSIIAVHAGTCISTRLRGEPNGYNHIRIEGDHVEIVHREWNGTRFVAGASKAYHRSSGPDRMVKDVIGIASEDAFQSELGGAF